MIGRRYFLHISLILTIVLSAAVADTLFLNAADTLPARLSDDAFWRIVTDYSEQNGYFRFENFVSNELEFQSVIPSLQQTTRPGGVYLGVGPEQNFTYIAALRPKIAFIFDIRRQNTIELLMYKALFEMSSDRADFISRLFARPRPEGVNSKSTADQLFEAYSSVKRDPAFSAANLAAIKNVLLRQHRFQLASDDLESVTYVYQTFVNDGPALDYATGGGTPGSTFAELMSATDGDGRPRGFLANEENFKLIQEMQKKNLIVPLVGDFAGVRAIRSVAQYLKSHGAAVTVFYLSNVEQYLFDQGDDWSRFYTNVASLPVDASSQFIRSSRFAYPSGPRQLQRTAAKGNFLSLVSPMQQLIEAFNEGHIESYNQVIQMSR